MPSLEYLHASALLARIDPKKGHDGDGRVIAPRLAGGVRLLRLEIAKVRDGSQPGCEHQRPTMATLSL